MAPTSTVSRLVEYSLRLTGVWPESCTFAQRLAWTLSLLVSQIFQYWYLVLHVHSDDLPDLLDCLSITFSNSLLFVKLIILWCNSDTFCNIVTSMSEDWRECGSAGCSTRAMTDKALLSRRFSSCIIGGYSMSVILYSASTLLAQEDVDAVPKERKLLLKMQLPFDATISPAYEVVVVAQIALQCLAALMAGMMMALIVTLILHVGGQIDIIREGLAEIPKYRDMRGSCLTLLKDLIGRHQRIITLSDNIEDLFSYMALMQILSNTIVLCFLGFVIIITLDTPQGSTVLVKCLPYYTIVNFEAFAICFAGEYLSIKSKSIGQAAYDSLWYELRPAESRILLLVILRAQRRLTITVGKFMDLSLESFAGILKASASYLSVLNAMY